MTPNYSAYNALILGHSSNGVAAFFTNGAPGSHWTTTFGSFFFSNGNLSVSTGGGASGTDAVMYWNYNSTPSWQQCSLVNLGTVPGSNMIGPAVNISGTAETYYSVVVTASALWLAKSSTGTLTYFASYSHAPAIRDGVNLCNDGAGHLTVMLNNNLTPILSATDTSITSGYPGIAGNSYSPRTSTITTWAGGTNVTGITINANVTGDTICGYSGFCTGKIHTPVVKNYNALRGSTVTGPGVSPETYIDSYNNITYPISDFLSDGTDYIVYVSEAVDCSTAGQFFYGAPPPDPGPFWEQRELGSSMWKNIAPQTEPGPYDVEDLQQYCSARTTPTDIQLGVGVLIGDASWQPAAFLTGVAERAGGFGLTSPWFSIFEGEMLPVLPSSKPDCTNWDNGWITQIKGGRILKNTGGPQPAVPPVM
jgi:hypothetical protein